MSWFNWGKKTENLLTYWPGGRVLNIRITYNPDTDVFEYRGNYGSKANFKGQDIQQIEINEVSHDRSIVIIQGKETCLGTLDILPHQVCDNIRLWINNRGQIDESSQETASPVPTVTDAPAPNGENQFEKLKQLKELLDLGIISEEEFAEKKAQLLKEL